MLFNSDVFVFAFLPLVLVGYYALDRSVGPRAGRGWLAAASLFFYGWWNPIYLPLLAGSAAFNFAVGVALAKRAEAERKPRGLLALGVAGNLGLLGYFKYMNFLVDNVNAAAGTAYQLAPIVLPLGISFFTFQQIAYLVDAHRGHAAEYRFVDYAVFVTFFPQLIAGPIVHHRDMMPQFARTQAREFQISDLVVGSTIFVIGMFKKVILADGVAPYAATAFGAADEGLDPSFLAAWLGALAFTCQIYFDFSGYSDMAIGLGRMFGIRLPLNFSSPYKAVNVIEFWRRWHITLSTFLRDYLYIPLGGNRLGPRRRYVNLMIVMLLGGLWHGAGWTFVIWGGLHGLYLMANHGWRAVTGARERGAGSLPGRLVSTGLTFVAVVFAWVFFRAESLEGALSMLAGMIGANGVVLPRAFGDVAVTADRLAGLGVRLGAIQHYDGTGFVWVFALLAIAWLLPNTQQLMRRFLDGFDYSIDRTPDWATRLEWRPDPLRAVGLALLTALVLTSLWEPSVFLYFQF